MFIRFGSPFKGIYPRAAERLLPDSAAQIATNVNITSGELRPIRAPLKRQSITDNYTVYRAEYSGVEKWMNWSIDVNVIKGPTPPDVTPRYYWTGDGEPRYATFTNIGTTTWALGVPNPTAKATVTPTGGTGVNVTRFYCYTYVTALGEESGPSPLSDSTTGKVDGSWAISGMGAFPISSGSCTAVYDGSLSTTVTASAVHWLRVGDQVTINGSVKSVTSVPSSTTFVVIGDFHTATTWARTAPWNTSGMYRRLYRTVGTTGDFQLVVDNLTATTYTDTLSDSQIAGDNLISTGWNPPPPQMVGLGVLPNGASYGFYQNQLIYSEPYQPHAYPTATRYETDFEIVGAASFGTAVVLGTAANPYIADGVDPTSVTLQKVDRVWPCYTKRSVVSVGDGVLYASNLGIVYVGQSGTQIWTEQYYSRIEWEPLNPASMFSAVADGKVFFAYTPVGSATNLLVFDPQEASLTGCSVSPTALYTDPRNGKMYLSFLDGVYEWNSSSQTQMLSYEWKSKEYELPNPVNFGYCRIDIAGVVSAAEIAAAQAAYDAALATNQSAIATAHGKFGALNTPLLGTSTLDGPEFTLPVVPTATTLTFEMYVSGELVFTTTLADTTTFALPAGFKYDNIAIRLVGNTGRVRSVKVAETAYELKGV